MVEGGGWWGAKGGRCRWIGMRREWIPLWLGKEEVTVVATEMWITLCHCWKVASCPFGKVQEVTKKDDTEATAGHVPHFIIIWNDEVDLARRSPQPYCGQCGLSA